MSFSGQCDIRLAVPKDVFGEAYIDAACKGLALFFLSTHAEAAANRELGVISGLLAVVCTVKVNRYQCWVHAKRSLHGPHT